MFLLLLFLLMFAVDDDVVDDDDDDENDDVVFVVAVVVVVVAVDDDDDDDDGHRGEAGISVFALEVQGLVVIQSLPSRVTNPEGLENWLIVPSPLYNPTKLLVSVSILAITTWGTSTKLDDPEWKDQSHSKPRIASWFLLIHFPPQQNEPWLKLWKIMHF